MVDPPKWWLVDSGSAQAQLSQLTLDSRLSSWLTQLSLRCRGTTFHQPRALSTVGCCVAVSPCRLHTSCVLSSHCGSNLLVCCTVSVLPAVPLILCLFSFAPRRLLTHSLSLSRSVLLALFLLAIVLVIALVVVVFVLRRCHPHPGRCPHCHPRSCCRHPHPCRPCCSPSPSPSPRSRPC